MPGTGEKRLVKLNWYSPVPGMFPTSEMHPWYLVATAQAVD